MCLRTLHLFLLKTQPKCALAPLTGQSLSSLPLLFSTIYLTSTPSSYFSPVEPPAEASETLSSPLLAASSVLFFFFFYLVCSGVKPVTTIGAHFSKNLLPLPCCHHQCQHQEPFPMLTMATMTTTMTTSMTTTPTTMSILPPPLDELMLLLEEDRVKDARKAIEVPHLLPFQNTR